VKLVNDWRCLKNRRIKGTISGDHGKKHLPVGSGAVGVRSTYGSAFLYA
jgi:hypothetical protein